MFLFIMMIVWFSLCMILSADQYMRLMLYAVYCKLIHLVVEVKHLVPELSAVTST